MWFGELYLFMFSMTASAVAGNQIRQDPDSLSRLLGALSTAATLTANPTIPTTMPTCLGGFDAPAPTLAKAMLTALPASLLGELANHKSRSSIASEFKAGQTPAWYQDLSPDIKDYILSVQTRATTGCTAAATAGAEGSSDEVDTSTSEALAARPTAAVVGGISGALGMFGLMLVL